MHVLTDEGGGGDLAPVLVVGVPDEPLRTLAGEVSQVVCAFGPGPAGVQSTLVDVDALKKEKIRSAVPTQLI